MPMAYPKEFRDDVVAVAEHREPGVTIKQTETEAPDPASSEPTSEEASTE